MKSTTRRYTWLNVLYLLVALPTVWFIMIALLKYVFNVDAPSDQSTSFLDRMGIRENPGWNINLLFVLGPLFAFLLTIFQGLIINRKFSKEQFEFHVTIREKWFPLLVQVFSGGLLLTLFICLVGENY